MEKTKTEIIAMVCHEANRAYCRIHGDGTQLPWELAADWQQESAIRGVEFRINNPDTSPMEQHNAWMRDKLKEGWVYGEEKNAEKKTHPCIKPYSELSEMNQRKDALFAAIVDALK